LDIEYDLVYSSTLQLLYHITIFLRYKEDPGENYFQNFYTNWNIFLKILHLFLEFFIYVNSEIF